MSLLTPIHFKIYVRVPGYGPYAHVWIYPTRKRMLEEINRINTGLNMPLHGDNTRAVVQGYYRERPERRDRHPDFATMHLVEGDLGIELLTHELGHVLFAYIGHQKMEPEIFGERWGDSVQEAMCLSLGKLAKQLTQHLRSRDLIE